MSRLVQGILVLTLMGAAVLGAEDLLIADFEGQDYGDWKVEGEAFGPGPARGTLPHQMRVTGFRGKGLVNTFYKGDGTTGTLTSPPFTIQRDYLSFLIGGGGYKDTTCIRLLVDGKVVRTATGPNTRPGGSERLDWHSWDVKALKGKQAVIQIVDQRTGGWGHINVDHILQSNRKRQVGPGERTMVIQKRYLHLPVKNGARKCRMKVLVGETSVDEFDIELADDEPDFWVFLDLQPYQGEKATITVDRLPEDSQGLAAITQANEVPGADQLYRETYRPQFHFTSRRGWNNDPNGLVYYDGEWHLYYQHNPYGWKWGNMHWGHAVSTDLVHWTELPIAIYPHRYGDWVFSGSATVDVNNTAGWQTGEEEVIVAAYTSTGRGEAVAYSNDRGRTFTDYEGNPVVKHSGRDPKIIWYPPETKAQGKGHWVMAVYDQRGKSRGIAFYTSPDLKNWTFASRIDGYYECPEIYKLPVDGDARKATWVVYAADGSYAIGSFDGKTFTPEGGKHKFNYGNCFYASQTFNDIPPSDGRRIQIAWGRTGHASMPFNQQMNFPVELTLRTTDEGIRQFAEPVREIERLHGKKHAFNDLTLNEGDNPLRDVQAELIHLKAELEPGQADAVTFDLRGFQVTYDARAGKLNGVGVKPVNGTVYLEVLVDRLSVEIFANHGHRYIPLRAVMDPEVTSLGLRVKGGPARVNRLEIWELKSAWKGPEESRPPGPPFDTAAGRQ